MDCRLPQIKGNRTYITSSLSTCPLREEESFSQRAFSIIYCLHLMTLFSVQIKKYGGKVLAVTNGNQLSMPV